KGPSSDFGKHMLALAMVARGEEAAAPDGKEASSAGGRVATRSREAEANTEPLLEVRDLVKHYVTRRHVVHAVNGVSFSIAPGETLALVGESGSGKTTVGRCLAGLVSPTSGDIQMLGQNLGQISTQKRAKEGTLETHVVFQEPRESLNPRWTLGASIEEP